MSRLSICIPTFNRIGLLKKCLSNLDALNLPFEYELIISDNHSSDGTAEYLDELERVRVFKHLRNSENIGGVNNVFQTLRAATGEYVLYLADDDSLIREPLLQALDGMDANPALAAWYAPWMLEDMAPFYSLPQSKTWTPEEAEPFFGHLIKYGILPEIGIYRRSMNTFLPSTECWWAFKHPAELLEKGYSLHLSATPFYRCSIHADQLGMETAKHDLHKFRAGLEYLLGTVLLLSGKQEDASLRGIGRRLIDAYMRSRMEVAERLLNGEPQGEMRRRLIAY